MKHMTVSQALGQLDELQRNRYAYRHAMSVVYYDAVTGAPEGSAAGRGEAMGRLSGIEYELFANAKTGELLDFLSEHTAELSPRQARETEVLRREYDRMRRIPVEEYVAYTRLTNEADSVWHRAKRENDYAAFGPYIPRIAGTLRRFSGYCDGTRDPYDVALGQYERGLCRERLDDFFARLREGIVPLLHRIAAEGKPVDDRCLYGDYPVEQQRRLSDAVMQVMGIDRTYCSIRETEHPFTINMNKWDVRITTHYDPNNFASSLFSVIHEGGHALYELHTGDALQYSCLAEGTSMGIHESQSRLYENYIGRSEAFAEALHPVLMELFGDRLSGVSVRQLWQAFNRAAPSLIRTEADELSYCLHIMVRYDMEKLLFDGFSDWEKLPALWNAKYEEYLGIPVPDDRRGILQDSHWSGGMMGYFPSYAVGSAYAAQMMAAMRQEVDVDGAARAGDLRPVNAWLEQRVWRFGKEKDPDEILRGCCGEEFDPGYYLKYLTEKYLAVYGLK